MRPDSPFYLQSFEVLKKSALFSRLDEDVLKEMFLIFRHQEWEKKQVVMEPAQTVERFFVLVTGRVKVVRANPATGREFTLFLFGSGDCFDVVSLLDGKEHDVYVVAMDDLSVLSAPIDTVRDWINKHPEFNRSFLPCLGKQMRVLTELASDVALHDTEIRLAKLILRHIDHEYNEDSDNVPSRLKLIKDLSHEELASMIGSARAVVNRHLQKLKQEGIMIAHRGYLEIKDLHALIRKIEEHLHSNKDKNNEKG